MRPNEAQKLKERAREEYEAAIRRARSRYKARLEAIDWISTGQNGSTSSVSEESVTTIRNAAQTFKAVPFRRTELEATLGTDRPSRAVVAKILNKLVEAEELFIVEQGKGRKATVYANAPTAAESLLALQR